MLRLQLEQLSRRVTDYEIVIRQREDDLQTEKRKSQSLLLELQNFQN